MTHDPRIRRTIDELVAGDVPPGPSIDDIARRVQRRVRRRAVAAGAACLGVAGLTWVAVAPADSDGTTIASGRADLAALPPEDLATFCLETLDAPVPADLTVFLGESESFDRIEGSGLDSRAEICSGVIKDALGESAEAVAAPDDVPSTSPEQELALADDVVTFEEYEAAMARHTECSAAVGIEITPTYSEAVGQFSYELVADVPGVVDPLIAHDACYQWHVAKIEAAYVTESTRSVPTQAPEIEAVASVLDPIELGPGEWLFPSELPAGLEFDFAVDVGTGRRTVQFSQDDPSRSVRITIREHDEPIVTPAASNFVVVGDAIWFGEPAGAITRATKRGSVSISGGDRALDIAVASALEVVAPERLPRPPFDLEEGPYIPVATFDGGELSATLSVQTDGRRFALQTSGSLGSGVGCCSELQPGELVAITGGQADPEKDLGVVHGLVADTVARLIVTFGDGSVVEVDPVDDSGQFSVRFVVVAVPSGAWPDVVAMAAFGADGEELGSTLRQSGSDAGVLVVLEAG